MLYFVLSHEISIKMARKIQDSNWLYSIFQVYINVFHTRRAYRRFEVHGAKNLPKNGAIIFGVNHSNTLMDAMVLLASSHRKKVFIARGDIFKKPLVAKILTFMRILPIYRMRNGVAAVRNNDESLDKAVDVIHDRVELYIFPEGTHRTKHSLLRLGKGIFHIALDSNQQFGKEEPVYIVPVAIEYGDYFRFRSTAMINYGEAINVTDYVKNATEENEAVMMNQLREMLYERISKLFTFIPDDEDYDATWEIVKMKNIKRAEGLLKKMQRNRNTVDKVLQYKEEHPEEAKQLFEKVNQFAEERVKNKISVTSTAKKYPFINFLWKFLVAIIGLPYFLASAVATLPVWVITAIIKSKLKDPAFGNTVSFGVKFVLMPLIVIAGAAVMFSLMPWYWAALGTILLMFSYDIFIDYKELARRFISDIRWSFKTKLRKQYDDLNLNDLFQ